MVDPDAARPSEVGADPPRYSERLAVPWWWWPVGLGVAGLLAAQIHSGQPGVRSWLPYVGLGVLVVVALLRLSRGRVTVDASGVAGGHHRLGLADIASVEELDAAHTRHALGRDADPRGWVFQRPWVHTAVKVVPRTDDPPYLLLSTRTPDRLAAALVALARPPRPDH